MRDLPQRIQDVSAQIARLPSIGPRQAVRIAFHLLQQGSASQRALAEALASLSLLKTCRQCYFFHEEDGDLCDICSNPSRRHDIVMVVEKETDLFSLERTRKFAGRYFIFGSVAKTGVLDPWQKERLAALKKQLTALPGGQATELVLAFNPNSVGDFASSILLRELQGMAQKITRLGRGLPFGGEVEFADEDTLGSALDLRR